MQNKIFTIPPEFEVFIYKFIDLQSQVEKLPDHPVKFIALTRLEELIEEFKDYEEEDEGIRVEGGKPSKEFLETMRSIDKALGRNK
jgi:hypothetical protein